MATQLQRKTVAGEDMKLVVSQANGLIGARRSMLRARAIDAGGDNEEEAALFLRTVVYPDLVAPVVEAEGVAWPISFEEFVELPEPFLIEWELAVYELNPHWQGISERPADVETLQKKESSSTGG